MVATVGARVGAVTVAAVMAVARVVAAKARAVAAKVGAVTVAAAKSAARAVMVARAVVPGKSRLCQRRR